MGTRFVENEGFGRENLYGHRTASYSLAPPSFLDADSPVFAPQYATAYHKNRGLPRLCGCFPGYFCRDWPQLNGTEQTPWKIRIGPSRSQKVPVSRPGGGYNRVKFVACMGVCCLPVGFKFLSVIRGIIHETDTTTDIRNRDNSSCAVWRALTVDNSARGNAARIHTTVQRQGLDRLEGIGGKSEDASCNVAG